MSKRVNPRRRPVTKTEADVKKLTKAAAEKGLNVALCIMLSALLDKGFLEPEQMRGAWDAINGMSESIVKGYINANDLRHMLEEEYGIYL